MNDMKQARIVMLVMMFVMLVAEAPAQSGGADARQQDFELVSDVFDNKRTIRVLLPPSYFEPKQAVRRYPVFYFTDGWDTWNAWGLPEVAEQLWKEDAIPEVIFIGVYNGGRTREAKDVATGRANEYLPYRDPYWPDERPDPNGHLFPDFLFDEVMPAVNDRFRTKRALYGPRSSGSHRLPSRREPVAACWTHGDSRAGGTSGPAATTNLPWGRHGRRRNGGRSSGNSSKR
jgi:enterochelin esterase-like enzyme